MVGALVLVAAVGLSVAALVTEAFGRTRGAAAREADQPALPAGFDPYIYRENGTPADPVNLVFLRPNAETGQVVAVVQQVLGWREVDSANTTKMMFRDHAQGRATVRQLELPLAAGSRFHLRLEDVLATSGQGYVLAAVHRDDSVSCGHIGTAFNDMRDVVVRAFVAAGYPVTLVRQGNTGTGAQCDGSLTGGDGQIAVIDLTRR